MPKDYRKQLTFQAGEISPRLYGRSDTGVYASGLQIADNVTIDKRGGAFKRSGLRHRARFTGNNARLFTLQVTRQQYYTMVIRAGELVIIAPGAKFLGSNLLTNGSFLQGQLGWTTLIAPDTSRVVFGAGEATLLPVVDDPQIVSEPDFTQGGIAWGIREIGGGSAVTFVNNTVVLEPRQGGSGTAGVFQEMDTPEINVVHRMVLRGNFTGGEIRVLVGTGEADGTYFDESFITNDDEIKIEFTPTASPFTVTLDCESPPSLFVVIESCSVFAGITKTAGVTQQVTVTAAETDTHLVNVGQLRNDRLTISVGTTSGGNDITEITTGSAETDLEFVPNNPTYWVTVTADGNTAPLGAILTAIATAAEVDVGDVGLSMPAPWTEDQLDEIHMTISPEGETMYFLHPNVAPQQLVYSFSSNTFIPLEACDFVEPPLDWAGMNWPSTGAHYQGRLWLGGAPLDGRQTLWASVSGSPLDFTKATGEAAGSLEFVLQERGKIEWMLGTKNMLIGTENGEHILTSDGPVITDTDFKIEQQSSYGSNNMQGLQVGERVFYATPDGRQLRAMNYVDTEDNWVSQDLTFFSEHITLGGIKRRCWMQHPNSIFILVLADGRIIALTYDRTAETIAWTRFTTPGHKAFDVATGRRNGRNELVSIGQRVGGFVDLSVSDLTQQLLDSYVESFYPLGGNVIDNLDHLEGVTVQALVDGAVDPPQTVVGGQITTSIPGEFLVAGVPFSAMIKTLPPDIDGSQIRSWKKRWNKVWALMLDSQGPIINGTRPPDRTPSTPMNTPEPRKTGSFKTSSLKWDENGQITIEEPLPVAMNVLAIYGEMGAETL